MDMTWTYHFDKAIIPSNNSKSPLIAVARSQETSFANGNESRHVLGRMANIDPIK
jgi:hypothetical protein